MSVSPLPPPRPGHRPPSGSRPGSGSDADGGLPPAVLAAAAHPDRRLGPYVILDELGRGGMGVVFRGYDVRLRRPVALKMLLHAGASDDQTRQRFAREARSAARLRHPAIVAVHEVGEHRGLPYLEMDLVEGDALDAILARGAMPPREAARIARELAEGLEHAHASDVIHRDVKPQNVLVDAAGRPHLTDYGLARQWQQSDGDGGGGTLTATGAFLGTPGYAAPEQVSGEADVGPRADVYGLGAVLYQAITGRPPFLGDSPMNVIFASMRLDPDPPRRVNPGVHADLETITLRCLEKEPGRRYASAAALAADLGRYLDGEPILARPLGPLARLARWTGRNRALAAAFVAVAIAAAGAVGFAAVASGRAASRARDEVAARARIEADEAWAALEQARAAGAGRAGGAQEDDDADARRGRDALVATALRATQAAGRLLLAAPDDADARAAVRRAQLGLAEAAIAAEQWGVAEGALEDARRVAGSDAGSDAPEAASLDALAERLRRARDRPADERRAAVEAIFAEAREGGLARRAGALEDAVFRLVRQPDAWLVERLVGLVDAANAELTAATRGLLLSVQTPDADERELGLAPIDGLEGAVDRWLAAIDDPDAAPDPTLPAVVDAFERLLRRQARGGAGLSVPQADPMTMVAASQRERLGAGRLDEARLAIEALGRLPSELVAARPRIVATLGRCVLIDADEQRAAVAGLALAQIGTEPALAAARRGVARFGPNGPYATRLVRLLGGGALPAPDVAPGSADARFDEALGRFAVAQTDEASHDLAAAWALDQARVRTRLDRLTDPGLRATLEGALLLERGDLDGARSAFERAIAIDARAIAPRLLRAEALWERREVEAALADAERAVELAPDLPGALATRAWLRREAGDRQGAIADATAAIERDPGFARPWETRALARYDGGDLAGARDDLDRAIAAGPERPTTWVSRAMVRGTAGDVAGAIADASRAIELAPGNPDGWVNRGNARLIGGDERGAEADFRRAIEADPRSARGWISLGNTLRARDPRGSIAAFTRATEIDRRMWQAWIGRAITHGGIGDRRAAQADLDRAAAVAPEGAEGAVVFLTRSAVRRQLGDLRGAAEDADRAVARAPRNAEAVYQRAGIRSQTGDLDGALADLASAIESAPRFAEAYFFRAQVRLRRDDRAGAIADLERAAEVDAGGPVGARARELLERIRPGG